MRKRAEPPVGRGGFICTSIRKAAGRHFDEALLEAIFRTIARWEPDITAHFLQMGEGPGERVLEFGALTGRAVVDLTAQSGEIKTSLIPIGAVQGVQLIDKTEATEFYVRSAGTEDIRYLAVGEADRTRLRAYAGAVELMLRRA